jgi:hypothetical protein
VVKPTSCCKRHHRLATRAGNSHSQVQSACCQRTPASAESSAVSTPTKRNAHEHRSTELYTLSVQPILGPYLPVARPCLLSWQSYELPPPTDLVTALQRLVI